MTNDIESHTPDILWKGSTVLLTILLALALVAWVGDRRSLAGGAAHGGEGTATHDGEVSQLKTELAVANEALAALGRENKTLQNRLELQRQEFDAFVAREKKESERVASISEGSRALAADLAAVKKKLKEAQRESAESRVALIRVLEHRDSLLAEKKRRESSGDVGGELKKRHQAEIANLKKTAAELEKAVAARDGRIQELEAKLKATTASSMTEDQVAALKSEFTGRVRHLEKSLKARASAEKKLTAQLHALQQELKSRESLLARTRRSLSQIQSQKKDLTRKLAASEALLAKTRSTPQPTIPSRALTTGDVLSQNRILRAKVKQLELELGRIRLDRDALKEASRRLKDRIRKLEAGISG